MARRAGKPESWPVPDEPVAPAADEETPKSRSVRIVVVAGGDTRELDLRLR